MDRTTPRTSVEAQPWSVTHSVAASSTSRILYVSAPAPVPSKIGPARRNFHILEQLTRFFEVSVLALGSDADADLFARAFSRVPSRFIAPRPGPRRKFARKVWRTLRNRCDFVPTLEPRFRRACVDLMQHESFDAIVLSCVLLRDLPLPVDIPVIADTHNVEFDVLRRTAASADSWIRRQYAQRQFHATLLEEQRSANSVDLLLATSDRDERVFRNELAISNTAVVPNGVDLSEFTAATRPGEPGVILFSGLMSYYPNQQAVRWFLDHVFPLVLRRVPTATFVVAGAAPPRWLLDRASPKVRVTGLVPDMRPFLEQASVFVAPLRIAGGTRVKILEAQATGRPVVSTSAGAEGLDAADGESILIADDANAFADHVVRALTDERLGAHLASKGLSHVMRHHDWNQIGEHLSGLLQTRAGLVPRHDAAE